MSQQLIARSKDLQKLQNEGYNIEISLGYLLIKDVPYVNSSRDIKRGILISPLSVSGDITERPGTHVAYWTGEHPCHSNGRKIEAIANASAPQKLGAGIQADFTFSAKADYRDYHHKMTTYIGRISGEATVLDETSTPRTFPVLATNEDDSIFRYQDTATSRIGTGSLNDRFSNHRIGIIGLGGTGSYVLDLVAKTCVSEIHLFDGDVFSQHNAFRSPGAPSIDDLKLKQKKVDYLKCIYDRMRRGIYTHDQAVDEDNVSELLNLDFVFICMDTGEAKRMIVNCLFNAGIPFVEVGMGIVQGNGFLTGLIRVTVGTDSVRDSILEKLNFSEDARDNEYSTNIQIAELNALNAALAVIRWKKLYGFYHDSAKAHSYGYSIAANDMVNEVEA